MRKTVIALALVGTLAGCSDDNTSSTAPDGVVPEATIALVTVTANPQFVTATATADPNFPWLITWSTTVRETAGVAARVDRINVVLVDTKVIYEGASLAALGSTSVPANGSVSYNLGLAYALPDGGKLAVVSTIVDLTDSKGNRIQAAGQLRIQ